MLVTTTRLITNPLLVGPALFLATRGPSQVRDYLRQLGLQPQVISTLSVLLGVGIARTANSVLNFFAFRNWQWQQSEAPWDFPNETAVVTGGSGGIAFHTIRKLRQLGIKVAILDIVPPSEEFEKDNGVNFYQCDLTSSDAVKDVAVKVTDEMCKPTILINNAGIIKWSHFITEATQQDLERMFQVNTLSHYYTVQAFLPGMITMKKGHVVTVASMASYRSPAGLIPYASTKAAALTFHEGLRAELISHSNAPFVATTSIHPTLVQTNMTKALGDTAWNAMITPESVAEEIVGAVKSGHGGQILVPRDTFSLIVGSIQRAMPPWFNMYMNTRRARPAGKS